MTLSLTLFQIERDGKLVKKVCGQGNITEISAKPVVTKGNKVTLVFQSSDFNPESHQHTGFLASYKKVGLSLIPTSLMPQWSIKIHPKHLHSTLLAAC